MEFYIRSLEQQLTPGNTIVRTQGRTNTEVTRGVIFINTECLDDCPDILELNNMLTKRLTPKKKVKGLVDHKVVAICCLASRGYSVNHESIHGVSDKEMFKIWSTLERSKTSSSSKLRPWILSNISFRSYEGFSSTMGRGKHTLGVDEPKNVARIHKVNKAVLVSNLRVDLAAGSPSTVRGAMVTDAKLLHAVRLCSGLPAPEFGDLPR